VAFEDSVHGGSGHGEQLSELGDGVFADGVQLHQVGLPAGGEFGLFAAQFALRFGDRHAFAGPFYGQFGVRWGCSECVRWGVSPKTATTHQPLDTRPIWPIVVFALGVGEAW
jgi:hypothetical protein